MRNKRPLPRSMDAWTGHPPPPISMLACASRNTARTEMGVYFARAANPPKAESRNIEMRCARLLACCYADTMGVYFANTGPKIRGVRCRLTSHKVYWVASEGSSQWVPTHNRRPTIGRIRLQASSSKLCQHCQSWSLRSRQVDASSNSHLAGLTRSKLRALP